MLDFIAYHEDFIILVKGSQKTFNIDPQDPLIRQLEQRQITNVTYSAQVI